MGNLMKDYGDDERCKAIYEAELTINDPDLFPSRYSKGLKILRDSIIVLKNRRSSYSTVT